MFETSNTVTLGILLDSLGYDKWKTIAGAFILPGINVLGTLCCTLSAFIFFKRKFFEPIFFYYRFLCLVYIVHLIHNILLVFLFLLRYFPKLNTYSASLYLIYYIIASSFLFHLEDVLQMAILLTRMKMFNSFVEKYFTFSPRLVSFTLFLICFFINFPLTFGFKISLVDSYFDLSEQKYVKFYFIDVSHYSSTLFEKILFGFTYLFLNLILSVVIGVGLNIFSLLKFKSYMREKCHKECEEIQNSVENTIRATLELKNFIDKEKIEEMCNLMQNSVYYRLNTMFKIQLFNKKMKKECKKEKNMLYMASILCSISVLSRIFIMFHFAYFFIFFNNNLISSILSLGVVYYSIQTLVPTLAIFVFFSFNKMFRQEMKRLFLRRTKKLETSENFIVYRRNAINQKLL